MRYVFLLLAMLLASPARAYDDLVLPTVDFSATVVNQTGGRETRERIFYKDGKLRIERGQGFSVTILDLKTQTQCILMADRTYVILPMDDELFRRFIARAPAMSGAAKTGRTRIEGMEVTKYAFGDDGALEAAGTYWLTDSGIMVRREYDEGVYGQNRRHLEYLKDIKVEKQPASLFVVPTDYRKAK